MRSSSIPLSRKPKPRLKLSTEQSCLIKRSQWILPLSDHLQETSQRGAELEEGVHEGHEAGAEARVAAEVAREGVRRVLVETLSEQRGSGVRVQFHTTRSSPANLIRIEDSKGSPVLHICHIRRRGCHLGVPTLPGKTRHVGILSTKQNGKLPVIVCDKSLTSWIDPTF
jgi:hypothetical protein